MCDYSLESVASRQAKVGDKLVSTRFRNSITGGFAASDAPEVAVCLMPGTELAFDDPVDYEETALGYHAEPERRSTAQTVARFRKVNPERPAAHHDALEFPDGTIVLLTRLRKGQTATVLQLPTTGSRDDTAHDDRTARETLDVVD